MLVKPLACLLIPVLKSSTSVISLRFNTHQLCGWFMCPRLPINPTSSGTSSCTTTTSPRRSRNLVSNITAKSRQRYPTGNFENFLPSGRTFSEASSSDAPTSAVFSVQKSQLSFKLFFVLYRHHWDWLIKQPQFPQVFFAIITSYGLTKYLAIFSPQQ